MASVFSFKCHVDAIYGLAFELKYAYRNQLSRFLKIVDV